MLLLPLLMSVGGGHAVADGHPLTLDGFAGELSTVGTRWEGFTDRVMGGISTMRAGYVEEGDARFLRMTGQVSTENNGGFIQVRLPLATRGSFDASGFAGIAVEVRGGPGSYYLHVRTRGTRLPWQYYEAAVEPSADWARVEIPFDAFEPESISWPLDRANLVSVALVGGKDEFNADVSLRLIELYR
jgi:hypothetical protein